MAGLIPQDFIDDLLHRTDIIDVVSERVQLKKSGRNYTACCPFHQEKTPSFSVSPDKQFYYCFGCGAGGNALGFVMDHDHLDFPQAVDTLASRIGVEVPREQGRRDNKPRQPAHSPLYAILQDACQYYQQALKNHPARQSAVTYLKNRGLSGAIARDFQLGFAPPGWDNLRKHFNTDELLEKHLLEAGLLAENEESKRRYDRFRDRIIFPIRDSRGRVIGFGGRVLGDDKPKYLNSPETPVFHKSQELYGLFEARSFNRQLTEIIVVEGYMDVIALAQQGLRNAVATLGTSTSGEHIKRLFRVVPRIIFCFDGDNAGRKAAWRALESALEHMKDGLQAQFMFLPEGSDPDVLIRQEGVEAFQARLSQQAYSLSDYFFNQLSEEINLQSLEGKAHLASLAIPLIERIPSTHLRQLMQQKLSQLTEISTQHLHHQSQTAVKQSPDYPPLDAYAAQPSDSFTDNRQGSYPLPIRQQPRRKPLRDAQKSVESPNLTALRTLLHHPELAQKVTRSKDFAAEDDLYAQLLVSILEALQKAPDIGYSQIIARWHGTEQGRLLRSLAEKEWLISADNLEQQFFDTIDRLSQRQRDRTIQQLIARSRTQELSDEEKQLLRDLLAQKKQ
ncbi:MAG: DNA primase [Gammaproteobacteria bacterium]|nr:DNA primase [Gammaproteobacteria bacterium]